MNGDNSGGSMVGDSGGSVVGNSGGSVDSDSWGGSDSGGNRCSGIYSWGSGNSSSSVDTSVVDSTGTNETAIAGTNETAIASTEVTSISSNELSISISSGGSDGHSHEGRQSNKGLHIDLC